MVGVIVGSSVATVVIIMMWAASLQKRVNEKGGCPNCGMPVPMFRKPKSLRQALWGGWTCSRCSTEIDREGHKLLTPAKAE
jgi:ribosomal protein L37AE/L43A